jgi:hypothetical protein
MEQSRRFPPQNQFPLASFAKKVSKVNTLTFELASSLHKPSTFFRHFHSRQATLHPTYYRMQVHTLSHNTPYFLRSRTQVSTEVGSTPTCHCRSPHLPYSQHQPPTGRQQPAPGTSSMCPRRIFRPAFRETILTRILHHLFFGR